MLSEERDPDNNQCLLLSLFLSLADIQAGGDVTVFSGYSHKNISRSCPAVRVLKRLLHVTKQEVGERELEVFLTL